MNWKLFEDLRTFVAQHRERLDDVAEQVATVDVLLTFADVARSRRWVRADVSNDSVLAIDQGRHPVLEHLLPAGTLVPNDLTLVGRHVEGAGKNFSSFNLVGYRTKYGWKKHVYSAGRVTHGLSSGRLVCAGKGSENWNSRQIVLPELGLVMILPVARVRSSLRCHRQHVFSTEPLRKAW